ncbi:hypothetical protein SNEBB_003864 [Seison nebaliae]|nr:hypothetical protein SNEBB_003864 [Seison nebaliae]
MRKREMINGLSPRDDYNNIAAFAKAVLHKKEHKKLRQKHDNYMNRIDCDGIVLDNPYASISVTNIRAITTSKILHLVIQSFDDTNKFLSVPVDRWPVKEYVDIFLSTHKWYMKSAELGEYLIAYGKFQSNINDIYFQIEKESYLNGNRFSSDMIKKPLCNRCYSFRHHSPRKKTLRNQLTQENSIFDRLNLICDRRLKSNDESEVFQEMCNIHLLIKCEESFSSHYCRSCRPMIEMAVCRFIFYWFNKYPQHFVNDIKLIRLIYNSLYVNYDRIEKLLDDTTTIRTSEMALHCQFIKKYVNLKVSNSLLTYLKINHRTCNYTMESPNEIDRFFNMIPVSTSKSNSHELSTSTGNTICSPDGRTSNEKKTGIKLSFLDNEDIEENETMNVKKDDVFDCENNEEMSSMFNHMFYGSLANYPQVMFIMNILNINSLLLANQMTYIEWSFLRQIPYDEFNIYARQGTTENLKYLERSVQLFNGISQWIQCMILCRTTPKERALVIEKLINIGEHLLQMKNYNTLLSLIGGINHSAISRLSKTMNEVNESDMNQLKYLTELLSSSGNYAAYRRHFNQPSNNQFQCNIPIIGIILKDIISINSASSDYFNNDRRLINFPKMTYLAKIFWKLNVIHHQNFPIERDDRIINTVLPSLEVIYTEEEIYELSLAREPRCATSRMRVNRPIRSIILDNMADSIAAFNNQGRDIETIATDVRLIVSAIIEHYDKDRDGIISRVEFNELREDFPFIDSFNVIDSNKDNMISRAELIKYFVAWNCRAYTDDFKHDFQETTYFKLAFCTYCHHRLTGVIKQGYRCRGCGINIHRQCRPLVVEECLRSGQQRLAFHQSKISDILSLVNNLPSIHNPQKTHFQQQHHQQQQNLQQNKELDMNSGDLKKTKKLIPLDLLPPNFSRELSAQNFRHRRHQREPKLANMESSSDNCWFCERDKLRNIEKESKMMKETQTDLPFDLSDSTMLTVDPHLPHSTSMDGPEKELDDNGSTIGKDICPLLIMNESASINNFLHKTEFIQNLIETNDDNSFEEKEYLSKMFDGTDKYLEERRKENCQIEEETDKKLNNDNENENEENKVEDATRTLRAILTRNKQIYLKKILSELHDDLLVEDDPNRFQMNNMNIINEHMKNNHDSTICTTHNNNIIEDNNNKDTSENDYASITFNKTTNNNNNDNNDNEGNKNIRQNTRNVYGYETDPLISPNIGKSSHCNQNDTSLTLGRVISLRNNESDTEQVNLILVPQNITTYIDKCLDEYDAQIVYTQQLSCSCHVYQIAIPGTNDEMMNDKLCGLFFMLEHIGAIILSNNVSCVHHNQMNRQIEKSQKVDNSKLECGNAGNNQSLPLPDVQLRRHSSFSFDDMTNFQSFDHRPTSSSHQYNNHLRYRQLDKSKEINCAQCSMLNESRILFNNHHTTTNNQNRYTQNNILSLTPSIIYSSTINSNNRKLIPRGPLTNEDMNYRIYSHRKMSQHNTSSRLTYATLTKDFSTKAIRPLIIHKVKNPNRSTSKNDFSRSSQIAPRRDFDTNLIKSMSVMKQFRTKDSSEK